MDEVEKAQEEFVLWLSFPGQGGETKAISNIHIQTKAAAAFFFFAKHFRVVFPVEGVQTMNEVVNYAPLLKHENSKVVLIARECLNCT